MGLREPCINWGPETSHGTSEVHASADLLAVDILVVIRQGGRSDAASGYQSTVATSGISINSDVTCRGHSSMSRWRYQARSSQNTRG